MWKMSGILAAIVLACGAKGWAVDSVPAKTAILWTPAEVLDGRADVHNAIAAD